MYGCLANTVSREKTSVIDARQRQERGSGEADPVQLCDDDGGILAVEKSNLYGQEPRRYVTIDELGWSLPGEGESYETCGDNRYFACFNKDVHFINSGKKSIFLKRVQKHCKRRECPVCVNSWAARESRSAVYRLKCYKPVKYRKEVHVILAPSPVVAESYNYDVKKLRQHAYKVAAKVGIIGGMMIFHGTRKWRTRKDKGAPDYRSWSPHFHAIAYGWISNVGDVYDAGKGWYVKNKGVRRSTGGTIAYLLSHATFRKGYSSVVWFGALGYRKLKVKKEEVGHLCPICSAELLSVEWYGKGDPPPLDFAGLYEYEDAIVYEPRSYEVPIALTVASVIALRLSRQREQAVVVVGKN